LTTSAGWLPRWASVAAVVGLVAAGLTQIVFPWEYIPLLTGNVVVSALLALRNVCLLVILACGGVGLLSVARAPKGDVVAAESRGPAQPAAPVERTA
ncbi:MAG TPA: hypothetical protein VGK17_00345, partial [Propionicimonas sp.]